MTQAQHTAPASPPRSPRDSLGCSVSALERQQEWIGRDFAVHRKIHGPGPVSRVETPASDRGVLVGIALARGHRRRIFSGNRSDAYDFEPDSCYIRSFHDPYRADIETAFDFLLLEISGAELERACDANHLPPVVDIACTPGTRDGVLAHLARALLPALNAPQTVAAPFVEQVVSAMQSHLVLRHHGAAVRTVPGGSLSATQLARAKELMATRLDEPLLIADVANACGTSRSQFIRGFKQATGTTPYRWLILQRVEHARSLVVETDLPLADVAVSCGFADQSHMTRTFTRIAGAAPGALRRRL